MTLYSVKYVATSDKDFDAFDALRKHGPLTSVMKSCIGGTVLKSLPWKMTWVELSMVLKPTKLSQLLIMRKKTECRVVVLLLRCSISSDLIRILVMSAIYLSE